MTKAMEMAIRTETKAITFYEAAARKTKNPVGKKMFLSIVEDEKHLLEDFGSAIDRPEKGRGTMRKTKADSRGSRNALLRRIKATTDEMEALKVAMEMEGESIEVCEKLSKGVRNPEEKALLERLVRAERHHYAVLSDTYQFLSDSGNWFMWEEHSIADGGTPWS